MNSHFLIRVLLYIALLVLALYFVYILMPKQGTTPQAKKYIPIQVEYIHKDRQVEEALKYCDSLSYRTDFAILINLAPHSGNYRFFGMNLDTKDTLIKGLVAHGHCKSIADDRFAQFSNESGSNCSSLGHYRVAGKYTGSFGTSYKLIGMDATNSNALDRYVVLHSHSCIPDVEGEDDICQSQGCPTVSPKVLDQLIPYLDNTDKPILLWIYDR